MDLGHQGRPGSGNPSSHTPAQRTSPHPISKRADAPGLRPCGGGGEEAGTDLGTLSLIERWAADGRANQHGAQGGAAAVVAGALCNPGCPGLQGTEVGDGNRDQMDGRGEPIGYSSKDRCSPKPSSAQDPICTQSWVLVSVSPRWAFRGLHTKNREVVPLGKVKRQDTFLQEPQQAARSRGCSYSWFCRTGRDGWAQHMPTSCLPHCVLSLSPEQGPL